MHVHIYIYDMTYSYMTTYSRVTRLSHMWHHLIIHVRHVYTYINACIYIYIWHDIFICDDVFTCYTPLSHVTSFDHSCAPCIYIYGYMYIYIYMTWLINVWRCIHVLHDSPTCDIIWSFMCAMPVSLAPRPIHMAHTWNCSTTSIWTQSAHKQTNVYIYTGMPRVALPAYTHS